jgi:hypothetical protein
MRSLWLILLLCLTACGNVHHELPQTRASDPIWPLNPGKWAANSNDLSAPPVTR